MRESLWRLLSTSLAMLLLVGCSSPRFIAPTDQPTEQSSVPPTNTPLPPSPDATAAAFLNALERGDYAAMHALLSPDSRAAVDAGSLANRCRNALTTASVLTVTARLQSVLREEDQAQASYAVKLETALFDELASDATMSLSLHDGQWGVDWDAGLIWPGLAGGNYFHMRYSIPVRANIYDRNGLGLATQGTIVTVGVIPDQIEDESALLSALSSVTGLSADEIRDRYATAQPDWKAPVADILASASVEHNDLLTTIPGVYRDEKDGRTYPHGAAAPHVVGWVAPVPAEKLEQYRARGYRGDEAVGIAGLEAWGEEILAGRHGGILTIVTATGEKVTDVAESAATPSRAIYATVDREFQEQVQKILGDRKGAIVVLDVHSGAVRALTSGPGFDPNIFVGPGDAVRRSQVLADPRHLLINRATQGTYPTGSVFKIVTMAAGMEEAGMDPEHTVFHCPGYWDGLGVAARKYCWKEDGHGDITLKDGLSASCNVTFYNVGHTVGGLGHDILPRYGEAFGIGQSTGLEALVEESGLMPNPTWKKDAFGERWYPGDTVNLAIGQGYLRATPLQVARMMAAVANGGTLYEPYVVQRIEASEETPAKVTQPEVVGTLPISPDHLAVMQEALLGVTTKSIGTASHRFRGLTIPVAGKTGTAEVGGPDVEPHSWFVAYAPADGAEIALAVIVENAGEGSTVAAPMARQVIEAYYGLPLTPLPPEAEEGYVPPTPTPTAQP